MAPHSGVLGSSPTVRNSTSQPQRGGSKGNVVPFTRRTGFGAPEKSDGSRPEGSRPEGSSVPARQRYSFDDRMCSRSPGGSLSSRSLPALRRPELVVPQTVQRGFAPPPTSARPPASPPQPRRASAGGVPAASGTAAAAPASSAGLLTRQFSSDTVHAPGPSDLQRKLEKCMEQPAAAPHEGAGAQPHSLAGSEPAAAQLASLKARHPLFGGPVVARAHALAAATLAPANLAANVATAGILADLGLDADTVAAALLADALDASPLTRPQLEKLMPGAVVDMVANVSRITGACQLLQGDAAAQEPQTASKLTTMLLAMADVRAVLVALAARLARLRSAAALAAAGGADLRAEAGQGLRVWAPLANRLGVWSLKAELEDLCFLVLQPQRAKELRDSLAQPQSRAGLSAALTQLKSRLDDIGLTYDDLSGRPKNLYGVHAKLQRKGIADADVSQVHDVRALRLIVSSKRDCYAALREVERLWPCAPGRFKDYIRTPKANGYQSLHTVVAGPDGHPIEVQIRTAKMHYIAEFGVAAHWRYKEQLTASADGAAAANNQLVGWARWLITWQLELTDGKTRPRGSPPRDASLASLAACRSAAFAAAGIGGSISAAAGGTPKNPAAVAAAAAAAQTAPGRAAAEAAAPVCTFPEHHPDCRFARYVASERFAPQGAPAHLASPTYIVLLDCTAASLPTATAAAAAAGDAAAALGGGAMQPLPSIEEVPTGTTVAALLSGASPRLARLGGGGRVRVLVNGEVAADPMQLLTHGDQVAVFDAQPRVAVSGNVLPFKRAASAPDAAAAAALAAGASPAAASSPWAAVQSVQSPAQSSAPAKPPGSPSRAIPSLGPRPAFLQSSARAVSGDYSGPQIGFDVAPPAVDEALPAGSPADESAEKRADRFAAQRSLLDRAFSRSASERLDTLLARPAWLPPDAQRRPQRSAQPQPA